MATDEKKYRRYPKTECKLKDIVALLRPSGYGNYDELSDKIVLCLECEEWTHTEFNVGSALLDLLGGLTVDSIDVEDNALRCWIKTDEFNWFDVERRTP